MTAKGKGSMSLNPSVLGQGFCREREALPGYKIKTAKLLITIFSPRAAATRKISNLFFFSPRPVPAYICNKGFVILITMGML